MTFSTQKIPSTAETSAPPAQAEKPSASRHGSCVFSTGSPTVAVNSTAKDASNDVRSSSSSPSMDVSSSPLGSQVVSRPAEAVEPVRETPDLQKVIETTMISQSSTLPTTTMTKKANKPYKERPASKKKKTKKSFRSLLKGMMKGSGKPRDIESERNALRTGLGGGAFIKVDKI